MARRKGKARAGRTASGRLRKGYRLTGSGRVVKARGSSKRKRRRR